MFTLLLLKLFGGYWGIRCKYYKYKSCRIVFKILLKMFHHSFGAYIPFNNVINGPINFVHGAYGVFISGDAKIGSNCTIYQHVTIGSNTLISSKGIGSPNIGDNCLIGAGAKIIGNVTIGNNCRIGANCIITNDIPDNSIVVMQKPIVITKDNLENKNYSLSAEGWGYMSDGKFIKEKEQNTIALLNEAFNKK